MPTLPPPGGDVPPYMSFVSEAKAQYEATKKSSNNKPLIEPPKLIKLPMPIPSQAALPRDGSAGMHKVEKIYEDSLDLIPSSSVKIQIIGEKVCLRCIQRQNIVGRCQKTFEKKVC